MIGVFDSGLGGLTVLRALRTRLPHEDFFYFADTHYLPYGDRPEAFLRERGVLIAEALVARGAKALVLACNTATAAAAEAIRAHVHVPLVALEPAVKPGAAISRNGKIGVIATTRTLQSHRFQRLIEQHASQVQVFAQACPGLAEAIELYGPSSQPVDALLERFIAPMRAAEIDTLVLGCTHYPWVADEIAKRLGGGVQLVDTSDAVARQLERLLSAAQLLGARQEALRMATSGAPDKVAATVARLWGEHLPVDYWEI